MTTQQTSANVPALNSLPADSFVVSRHTGFGCLKATGEDALDLLNRLSTNKVDHLQPGHWAPTVLTSDRGRIVDALSVIQAGDCVYLLTSPGQQQTVIEWLDKYTIMEDLEVEDVSASTSIIASGRKRSRCSAGSGVRRSGAPARHAVPRADCRYRRSHGPHHQPPLGNPALLPAACSL